MDDPAFAPSVEEDDNTQLILLHAANHNLHALKPLLRVPGAASVQDPETGYTPLHAAIAACDPSTSSSPETHAHSTNGPCTCHLEEEEEEVDIEAAKDVVRELFLSGAIWNDLDAKSETPGCLAWRLGQKELYNLCVDAGVRAEMLLGLIGGYEALESDDEVENDVKVEDGSTEEIIESVEKNGEETSPEHAKKDVNSEDYLKSELKFEDDKLLDADDNGVMMAWETDIMRRSVDLLLPDLKPGKRILNVGFGMGIIDRMFHNTKPFSHHIIEAHPRVLQKLSAPGSDFGQAWRESAPEGGKYVVHDGRWQDVVKTLLENGEMFDVIYFDTFGEDYSQLKLFFTEYVIGLLDPEGRFGFFNGLGADRRVCYDVYTKVVELDLCDAGMDVEWTNVPVGKLGDEGEGEWKGVRRRYWTLEEYRLPVCTFLG
ncbi:S-adenosyl-L-methionine-dependent methyltransferase [Bisporella sp. PMI_857]|nr:S-adenosyl-L-methionine-dependent methyltransferase [Bisporella sp. PMI_857]